MIEESIKNLDEKSAKRVLQDLLKAYMTPAFGALPKGEIELIMLKALEDIRYIDHESQVYELVSNLRITRAKARKLIYERELRRSSPQELDAMIKQILKRPIIQKEGELFILEVENPLVSDHLKSKITKLGFISDGSFSPSIVKLPLDAVVALIGSYLTKEEQEQTRKLLIRAGAPDMSFSGVLKAVFKGLGKKLAAETGEKLVEEVGAVVTPILESGVESVVGEVKDLF